jgi:hypothetical protein
MSGKTLPPKSPLFGQRTWTANPVVNGSLVFFGTMFNDAAAKFCLR